MVLHLRPRHLQQLNDHGYVIVENFIPPTTTTTIATTTTTNKHRSISLLLDGLLEDLYHLRSIGMFHSASIGGIGENSSTSTGVGVGGSTSTSNNNNKNNTIASSSSCYFGGDIRRSEICFIGRRKPQEEEEETKNTYNNNSNAEQQQHQQQLNIQLPENDARRHLYSIIEDMRDDINTDIQRFATTRDSNSSTSTSCSSAAEPSSSLMLSLLDEEFIEMNYTYYPEGGWYRRHVDAHYDQPLSLIRRYSFIIYLNTDNNKKQQQGEGERIEISSDDDGGSSSSCWTKNDGGYLRIHLDGGDDQPPPNALPNYIDVQPTAGTLVLFMSDRIPHEVLETNRERCAIVGWFLSSTTTATPSSSSSSSCSPPSSSSHANAAATTGGVPSTTTPTNLNRTNKRHDPATAAARDSSSDGGADGGMASSNTTTTTQTETTERSRTTGAAAATTGRIHPDVLYALRQLKMNIPRLEQKLIRPPPPPSNGLLDDDDDEFFGFGTTTTTQQQQPSTTINMIPDTDQEHWKSICAFDPSGRLATLSLSGQRLGALNDDNNDVLQRNVLVNPALSSTLVTLDLGNTDIPISILTKWINSCPRLEQLHLGGNGLDDEQIGILVNANDPTPTFTPDKEEKDDHPSSSLPLVLQQSLRLLDLRYNRIGSLGSSYLADGIIRISDQLITLYMEGNNLGDDGVTNLVQYGTGSIKQLFLGQNGIGPNGAKALADSMLYPTTKLSKLYLEGNNIGPIGARAFIDVLQRLDDHDDDDGADDQTARRRRRRTLERLYVDNNGIGKVDSIALGKALRSPSMVGEGALQG